MSSNWFSDVRSPLETDDELCLALGRISARWSTVELCLSEILNSLVGHAEAASAMYFSAQGFRARVEMLRAAAKHKIVEENANEYTAQLLQRVYDAWKSRKRLIHQPYVLWFLKEDGIVETSTGTP